MVVVAERQKPEDKKNSPYLFAHTTTTGTSTHLWTVHTYIV